MRRTGMVLGLFGLTLTACPSDDGEGSGDTDTDGTSTGGMTMSGTSPTTAMSTSSSTTTDTTTTATTDMTTDMTTSPTTDMTTDMTTSPTSSSGGDMCTPCVEENCGDQLGACVAVEECACWLTCTSEGGDPKMCGMECMGPPPMEYNDVLECVAMECEAECLGGGSSGSGSSGGGDGMYGPCDNGMMCPDDLECNMFLNICTIQCDGDPDVCPEPSTGDATPDCSAISNTCILPCNDGETCPDGTECVDVGMGNNICGAPA